MCLLIYKPKDEIVPDSFLYNWFKSNSDWAWLAYADGNRVKIIKSLDYKEFKKAYDELKDYPMIIHFRLATSGLTDELNCHPFIVWPTTEDVLKIEWEMALAHNWVLYNYTKHWKYSDTFHFVKHFAKIKDNRGKAKIESHIGQWNKLVSLDKYWVFSIYNEKQWHWKDGVWYSNTSYQAYKTLPYKDTYKPYGSYYSSARDDEYGTYSEDIMVDWDSMYVHNDVTIVSQTWQVIFLKKWEYYIDNPEYYTEEELEEEYSDGFFTKQYRY